MTTTAAPAGLAAYYVKGDDAVLVAQAVRALVPSLLEGDDEGLAVDDVSGDEADVAAVVDAAQTPPFLTARRVVIARDVGRFSSDELAPLLAYLADPLPTTAMVLVAGGGQTSRKLLDAVRKVGHVVDASVPTGKGRQSWLASKLKDAPVRLDAAAAAALGEHLGEDVARVDGIVDTLAAAFGEGARLTVDDLEPFLGDPGATAPWDLTDAIDRGDTAAALDHLHRLLGGGRHPLVVLASLHTHYGRMLRLDGADVADEAAAASALALTGSTFPARKALAQARRLGHPAIGRAITLLSEADLALKGAIEWPPELVLEVLVARLSRLAPRRR